MIKTKDGHAIEKGDFIKNKNGNLAEVCDVDFDFVLTREIVFDDGIDDYRMEPITYVSRQELRHCTFK